MDGVKRVDLRVRYGWARAVRDVLDRERDAVRDKRRQGRQHDERARPRDAENFYETNG